ncbi:hypothetical protein HRG_012980 [Hirsutella rhossiliensis]
MAKNIGNGADKATSEQAGNLAGQFPSQSITVDKMVTDLSERDFQTGLSYVAVSRVKTLEGLMIDTPFERASLHYEKLPDGVLMKVRDEHRRKQQQLRQPLFQPRFS